MKIIIIEPSGRGKLSHYCHHLGQNLQVNHSVVLVTAKSYELTDKKRDYGLQTIFGPEPENRDYRALFNLIRSEDPDIIHWHWFPTELSLKLPALFRALFRAKVFYTAHNVIPHEMAFGEIGDYKQTYEDLDGIIVHSEYDRDNLINFFKIDKKKINVTRYGNCVVFKDDPRQNDRLIGKYRSELRVGEMDKLLLFFGYINRSKGIDVLIDAFARIKNDHSNVKLIIAGKSTFDIDSYRRTINDRGLGDAVIIDNGYLSSEAIARYFNVCDLVLLPHTGIGQSPNVATAYYFGKPVVATYPQWEIVRHGKSGLLIPIGDAESIATSVNTLLEDNALLLSMASYAREFYDETFSWPVVVEKLVEFYRHTPGPS